MIKFYKCTYDQYMNKVLPREKAQNFYILHNNTGWTVDQFVQQFLKLNEQCRDKEEYIREVFTKLINTN